MNWLILIAGYIIIAVIFFSVNSKTYKNEDDSTPWIGNMLLMCIFELFWIIVCFVALGA